MLLRFHPFTCAVNTRVRRLTRKTGTVAAAVLLFGLLAVPNTAFCDEGGKSAEGKLKAGEAFVKVVAGISKIVDQQNNNCVAAGCANVGGSSCEPKSKTEKGSDKASFVIYYEKHVDLNCGYASGSGHAWEGMWGMTISGWGIEPDAFTLISYGHDGTANARGWGKASVDGNSDVKTLGTADPHQKTIPDGMVLAKSAWPDGQVLMVIHLDDLELTAPPGPGGGAGFRMFVEVDGIQVWSADVSLSGNGDWTTGSGISSDDFNLTENQDGGYTLFLDDFLIEIPIMVLPMGKNGSSATIHVHAEAEMEAKSGGGAEESVPEILHGLNVNGQQDRTPSVVVHGNIPNPFNPTTKIRFAIAEAGPVTVTVYDTAGRMVRTLLDEHLTAGAHSVTWNGRNDMGTDVSSGVYFYVVRTPAKSAIQKMTLVK